MTIVKSWRQRAHIALIILAAAVAFGACDEQLDSGAGCPILCPTPPGQVHDTSFVAVAMDTSLSGFPGKGLETALFLAAFGDTLQTRGVIRFDSLPQTFRHDNSATDSATYAIDTGAVLRVYVAVPDTLGQQTTVEAYDVDLGGPDDTNPDAVASAFTPDRLLGSRVLPPASIRDSIDIPIDPAKLLLKVQTDTPDNRLRVGLRVTNAKLSLYTTNFDPSTSPKLMFRPSAGDTSVAVESVLPASGAPADEPTLADALKDYLTVVIGPPAPPPATIRVGGLPGRRAYLLFDVPARIIDSTDIIRASLLLTQRPSPGSAQPYDTVGVQEFAVSAGSTITDLNRALGLLVGLRPDTVKLMPTDSGTRTFEMLEQVNFWRSTTASKTPRAMALRSTQEGKTGGQIDFFSVEAPADVRPVLKITYLPRRGAPLP
ncbi:MAG TPA: hypothetical protein VJ867_02315 [Gemmatimonadaceae bacterium]|nr:hypothetical protein [Gemmatimonadaceae bacterium]